MNKELCVQVLQEVRSELTNLHEVVGLLINELNEPPKLASRPKLTLQTENQAGYTLLQCCHTMLLRWDEGNPRWPIDKGIAVQAKLFGVTPKEIWEAIATNHHLLSRFKAFPRSGYQQYL